LATLALIDDYEDNDYDPFAQDALNFGDILDPWPQIHEWRAQGPVIRGAYRQLMGSEFSMAPDLDSFIVVGTKEIAEGIARTDIFSNTIFEPTIGMTFGRSLTVMDKPEHPRFRQPFQKLFLPHNVKRWGPTIVDPIVKRLMDKFVHRSEADLVREFTRLYPFEVIFKQLALPEKDMTNFQRMAFAQTDYFHMDKAAEAGRRLGVYFKGLIDERRINPGDDLISFLTQMRIEDDYVDQEVLISFLRQLMNAGGDTTHRSTSTLMVGLLRNPDQLEALRKDRTLIPQAIEEALRWEGPVIGVHRLAMCDTDIGGVRIPKGSAVVFLFGAANHDPEVFEDPDSYNLFRRRIPNFSFARGPHICVGQHLARLEMTRALHAILDNLRNLRLDPDKPAPELRGCIMRAPQHIHVKFDPA
jgi:cytochrome P450